MENQINTPDAFGLTGEELATVVLGNLGLKCSRLSMFSATPAAAPSTSQEAVKAVSFPQFRRAAEILANPLVKLTAAKGGSALAVEGFSVYGNPLASGMEFAAVLQPGNASLVLYFASIEIFVDWWADQFACQANIPVTNTLVPALPAEEFTFILHVLDSYRRIHMESMLLYSPLKESRISGDTFMASFGVALKSGDIRWLMPALFSLTPGLSGTRLDLHPEIMETAEALHFIRRTKNPDSGTDELRFLDPAAALGYEFATSWLFGLGLSVEALTPGGMALLGREFLAPTALANHVFSVEKGQTGLDMFTHCALTLDEYRQHMTVVLWKAAAKVLEPAHAAQPPVQSSPQKPTAVLSEPLASELAGLPSTSDVTLIRPRSAAADVFNLSLQCGERRIPMSGQMRLGSDADNDLALPGEKVAPHHALIQRQGFVYKITDLNSESGTYVNGKRITGATLLQSGDILLIGDTKLTISDQM